MILDIYIRQRKYIPQRKVSHFHIVNFKNWLSARGTMDLKLLEALRWSRGWRGVMKAYNSTHRLYSPQEKKHSITQNYLKFPFICLKSEGKRTNSR